MRLEASDFPDEIIDAIATRVAERVLDRLAPPSSPGEVMTTVQAAAYMGLSKQQMEIWRCRGGGPVFVKLARRVRYRRNDLDAWLADRQRGSTSEGAE